MTWLIILEYIEIEIKESDFKSWKTEEELIENADYGESFKGNFLTEYHVYEKSHSARVYQVSYFAFTSLSTVGFGDLHPQSDAECFICSFILLFGVAIFSYCMGQFTEIL